MPACRFSACPRGFQGEAAGADFRCRFLAQAAPGASVIDLHDLQQGALFITVQLAPLSGLDAAVEDDRSIAHALGGAIP